MENTSGQGETAEVPQEIIQWNWGAFFLNWIWGIRNKTYIAFAFFIPIVGFIIMIVLGMKGNEWAWQNRRWESIEQFEKEQKTWSRWGLRFAAFLFIMGILGLILTPLLKLIHSLHSW